jgi:tripartite ATP-independent transporter DctM subunit
MVYFYAKKRNYPKSKRATWLEFWRASKRAFFPMLAPVIIIGGILTGVITPTEAGIMTVVYSLILGIFYREISLKGLLGEMRETLNSMLDVIFIVCAANVFAWILATAQIPKHVVTLFTQHISAPWLAILVMNILILFAGTFMETISAITILTPVFMPIAIAYGLHPVHFALIMILNLMIGLLTPPVGMVLYVLSSVSKVSFEKIAKAALPFVIALIAALLVLSFVPQMVLWLPNLVFNNR